MNTVWKIGVYMLLVAVAGVRSTEVKEENHTETYTDAASGQRFRDAVTYVIQKKDGECRIVDEMDARIIRAALYELENEWMDAGGYAQAMENMGNWWLTGPQHQKLWEKPRGRLHIYQNGNKIHDILIISHGLCRDEDEPDKHKYLCLHWEEPLSMILSKYTIDDYKCGSSASMWCVWGECRRYRKDELENGPVAQLYRLKKYINAHVKDIQEASSLKCILAEEFTEGESAAQTKKLLINHKAPAACLAVLRLTAEAQQGDSRAQYELGMLYLKGEIISQCQEKGIAWLRKAAEAGEPEAQDALRAERLKTENAEKELDRRAERYHKAAEKGDAEAQYQLGKMYYMSASEPEDKMTGYMWLMKAAKGGSAAAQYLLAQVYTEGEVVVKDDEEAKKWLQKATDNGYVPAIEALLKDDNIPQLELRGR